MPAATSTPAGNDQVMPLGQKQVGSTATFTVPPGTASITIVEQVVSAPPTATFTDFCTVPNTAVPLQISSPTGVIFDQFTQPSPTASPAALTQLPLFFDSTSPGIGTLTLPNTTGGLNLVATGLPAGTWSFVVSDLAHVCTRASNCASGGGSASSVYDVTVILKPGGAAPGNIPSSGRLDVTFNLAPGNDPTAPTSSTAAGDPDVQRMTGTLEILLGQAGLRLGTIDYVDVPSSMASRIASGVHVDDTGTCGELQQLLATAPRGRQVNVFMVPDFVSNGAPAGTQIAGIDGTIPGPATLSPNFQSGVAVSLVDLRHGHGTDACKFGFDTSCGADRLAYVVAHEIGHFLGLYHVTEQPGTLFDPLDDTPTCACQQCASDKRQCADSNPAPQTPHVMSVSECEVPGSSTCGGGDNLMFWLLASGSVGQLSGQQSAVMRANPAVY